jgi:hypothetical protein
VAQPPLDPGEGWLGGGLPDRPDANIHLRTWVRPDAPRMDVLTAGPITMVSTATIQGLVVNDVVEASKCLGL